MAKLDKDDLELILNACLNEALCRKQRIKNPNSNTIAEFVTNWINKTDLSVGANETSENNPKALRLHEVVPMLLLIEKTIDKAVENVDVDNETECDKISDAVELITSIANENKVFVRN